VSARKHALRALTSPQGRRGSETSPSAPKHQTERDDRALDPGARPLRRLNPTGVDLAEQGAATGMRSVPYIGPRFSLQRESGNWPKIVDASPRRTSRAAIAPFVARPFHLGRLDRSRLEFGEDCRQVLPQRSHLRRRHARTHAYPLSTRRVPSREASSLLDTSPEGGGGAFKWREGPSHRRSDLLSHPWAWAGAAGSSRCARGWSRGRGGADARSRQRGGHLPGTGSRRQGLSRPQSVGVAKYAPLERVAHRRTAPPGGRRSHYGRDPHCDARVTTLFPSATHSVQHGPDVPWHSDPE
jgi:hypothetical protein